MTSMRSRWAAIGAAVAVTLGAGGISLGQAALSTGDKPVFVGIEPCRLVDTRPGDTNIGGRTQPLGANDTLTLQVTGSTGQCSGIPADAVAAAMNVTAIQPTAQSFLSVYPADADLPNASNLNWAAGDPPTPNKVDVALAATGADAGAVKLTNSVGTVHVAADLVGYYIDHTHDDRYYTKGQTQEVATASFALEGDLATVGVASNLAAGAVEVNSLDVTAPGPGQVVLTASGFFSGGIQPSFPETDIQCSLSTDGSYDTAYRTWFESEKMDRAHAPFTLTRIVDLTSAGTVEASLLCAQNESENTLVISRISAVYMP